MNCRLNLIVSSMRSRLRTLQQPPCQRQLIFLSSRHKQCTICCFAASAPVCVITDYCERAVGYTSDVMYFSWISNTTETTVTFEAGQRTLPQFTVVDTQTRDCSQTYVGGKRCPFFALFALFACIIALNPRRRRGIATFRFFTRAQQSRKVGGEANIRHSTFIAASRLNTCNHEPYFSSASCFNSCRFAFSSHFSRSLHTQKGCHEYSRYSSFSSCVWFPYEVAFTERLYYTSFCLPPSDFFNTIA